MIATLLRRHPVMGVHALLVLLLVPGLVAYTGARWLGHLALYLGLTLVAYFALQRSIRTRGPGQAGPLHVYRSHLAWAVLLITTTTAVLHWVMLGHVPLIEALRQSDDLRVNALRHAATDVPGWIVYTEHFVIKALVPVALILLWPRDRRLFWPIALIGACYALSLIQKSHVITLFVPLWVAFLISARWKPFLTLTAAFVLVLGFLVVVGKPEKLQQAGSNDGATSEVKDEGVARRGLVGDILLSLGKRILITPGWTVAVWFERIPSDIPFQKGAAIRPLGALLGKPYRDLSSEIYGLEHPEYVTQGVQGTVGSPAFMYDYANFGTWGLALAGAITGALLSAITSLFGQRWRWAIALNTYPLLALAATALPTVLLSHGWLLTLMLFALFNDRDEPLT